MAADIYGDAGEEAERDDKHEEHGKQRALDLSHVTDAGAFSSRTCSFSMISLLVAFFTAPNPAAGGDSTSSLCGCKRQHMVNNSRRQHEQP